MLDTETMEYIVPTTITEAAAALQVRKQARIIAGGTDLMVAVRDGRVQAECLVDVSRIAEMIGIVTEANGALRIGAATRIDDIIRHPAIVAGFPALVEAGSLLGGWQIQNMATLAGNICNASPAAETAGPLLAGDAEIEIFGPAGQRLVPAHKFWTGPGKTVLAPSEFVTAILIPAGVDARRSSYQRIHIRHSVDIALVSATARLEFNGDRVKIARVALGAVAPTPIRVREAEDYLVGRTLNEKVLDQVEELATAAARPITDVRAGAAYRKAMAGVLARRVVGLAAGFTDGGATTS